MTAHVQQTLRFPWQGRRQCKLQLLIQPWICAPGTHYGWVDQGSVEHEVCPTLLHMASTGNRTPDLRPSDLEYNALSTEPHAPTYNHGEIPARLLNLNVVDIQTSGLYLCTYTALVVSLTSNKTYLLVIKGEGTHIQKILHVQRVAFIRKVIPVNEISLVTYYYEGSPVNKSIIRSSVRRQKGLSIYLKQ